MKVSDIIDKIANLNHILEQYDKDDLDVIQWGVVIELLEEYRDELMNKKVV